MKISTIFLQAGMKLARPVYGSKGIMLLNKGVFLTEQYILSLRRHGILTVDVDCYQEDYFNDASEILEDSVRCSVMNKVKHGLMMNKINIKALKQQVELLIDEIINGKKVIGNLTEICSYDMYTYAHSVDVCTLALVIGIKLNYERDKLIRLGLGCLLHDLGKLKVPPEILNKPGTLNDAEYCEMKKHPVYGYKKLMDHNMYNNNDEIEPESANIVMNHHERYDGSGYPRGLKESEIDEMSAICAIADVYNAITTDRVYRKAIPSHEAYEMIMASGGVLFEPKLVETFLKCIVPYEIGSVVKLSNGIVGVVCRLNPGLPLRPVVKVLNSREEIDLLQEKSVVIIGALQSEELVKNCFS